MGKVTGFLEHQRLAEATEPKENRVKPAGERRFDPVDDGLEHAHARPA